MDMRMPGMSGDAALATLRAGSGPNNDVPVLAFTANADLAGFDAAALSGFDGVVRKPIVAAELFAAIAEAINWQEPLHAAAR
jgi:CheY-like chemotaxis protein